MNETSTTTPPEWCQPGDLENFVLLLNGLKDSLAQEQSADPQAGQAEGRRRPAN
ncbi:hypothetical protein [Kitasatospora sp. NBC_01266]|jgi:hypothetical protein|uniref:hypothetical protein n=1 Tax=Kitasatospora sp. NBC_01266 TaxID=2903572 RepID=UPI002E33D169|nr:hypothetical protein [Kitasatospora sp. NBC_01266]